MRRPALARTGARRALMLAAMLALAGCGVSDRPPRLDSSMRCELCGMPVSDLRFAAARRTARGWRPYDSIECLARDASRKPGEALWLPDYDAASLHPADSMWVVRGRFPTPMGGGLAAFLNRETADSVAAHTRGTVSRFDSLREATP